MKGEDINGRTDVVHNHNDVYSQDFFLQKGGRGRGLPLFFFFLRIKTFFFERITELPKRRYVRNVTALVTQSNGLFEARVKTKPQNESLNKKK